MIGGDFFFTKIEEKTQKAMAGIPFRITSVTTGESHVIVTDANGYFSSASDYVRHSVDTNAEKAEAGLWFGMADGVAAPVNDTQGALDVYKRQVRAFAYGARSMTHVYNGMTPFNHRANGLVGAAYRIKSMYGEIICDGNHSKMCIRDRICTESGRWFHDNFADDRKRVVCSAG